MFGKNKPRNRSFGQKKKNHSKHLLLRWSTYTHPKKLTPPWSQLQRGPMLSSHTNREKEKEREREFKRKREKEKETDRQTDRKAYRQTERHYDGNIVTVY